MTRPVTLMVNGYFCNVEMRVRFLHGARFFKSRGSIMSDDGLFDALSAGLKAKGPWGELESETKAEGIILAIGVAAGIAAFAYGVFKNGFNKVSK